MPIVGNGSGEFLSPLGKQPGIHEISHVDEPRRTTHRIPARVPLLSPAILSPTKGEELMVTGSRDSLPTASQTPPEETPTPLSPGASDQTPNQLSPIVQPQPAQLEPKQNQQSGSPSPERAIVKQFHTRLTSSPFFSELSEQRQALVTRYLTTDATLREMAEIEPLSDMGVDYVIKQSIQQVWRRLPEDVQAEYQSPEHIFALRAQAQEQRRRQSTSVTANIRLRRYREQRDKEPMLLTGADLPPLVPRPDGIPLPPPEQRKALAIPLTQGKVAFISPQDAYLARHIWFYGTRPNSVGGHEGTFRNVWVNGKNKITYLHTQVIEGILKRPLKTSDRIEHLNGIELDNRRENLLLVTYSESNQRAKRRRDNKSGYKGVDFDTPRGLWRAQIAVAGKHKFLGRYPTAREAAQAYNEAATYYYGEVAKLNQLNDPEMS